MNQKKRDIIISSYPAPSNETVYGHIKFPTSISNRFSSIKNEKLTAAKIVLIGPPSVGKTSIFLRVVYGEFPELHKTTIGLDFMNLNSNVFGHPFEIAIWDTAGSDQHKAIGKSYYRGADCVIMCFDLNEKDSPNKLLSWYDEVKNNSPQDVKIFIVGNKKDAVRNVEDSDILKLKKEIPCEYWECSAKNNENIDKIMERVVILCYERKVESLNSQEEVNTIELKPTAPPQKKWC